jgi:hypothetical protein
VRVLFWFNRLYAVQTDVAERAQITKRGSDVCRDERKLVKRKRMDLWYCLRVVRKHFAVLDLYLQAVEVSSVEVSTLWIIHPSDLVSIFGSLGALLQPLIQICFNGGHFAITLSLLLSRAIEDVSINPEHNFMDSRVYSIKSNNVYERLNVRPDALGRTKRFFVGKRPKLTASTWKLRKW